MLTHPPLGRWSAGGNCAQWHNARSRSVQFPALVSCKGGFLDTEAASSSCSYAEFHGGACEQSPESQMRVLAPNWQQQAPKGRRSACRSRYTAWGIHIRVYAWALACRSNVKSSLPCALQTNLVLLLLHAVAVYCGCFIVQQKVTALRCRLVSYPGR